MRLHLWDWHSVVKNEEMHKLTVSLWSLLRYYNLHVSTINIWILTGATIDRIIIQFCQYLLHKVTEQFKSFLFKQYLNIFIEIYLCNFI